MTVVHLSLVVFVIIAAFTKADVSNAKPFMPFSYRGIFDGASIVFFAYVGFDAIATTVEEVRSLPRTPLVDA
jgi:basic amino acid/polyamine antiporter, APA family